MFCGICLDGSKIQILDMFDDEGIQLRIAEIISKHFWFSPSKDDPALNKICLLCWTKINDFHEFYCFVEKAHEKLTSVTKSPSTDPVVIPANELQEQQLYVHNDNAEVDIHSTNTTMDMKDPLNGSDIGVKQGFLSNKTETITLRSKKILSLVENEGDRKHSNKLKQAQTPRKGTLMRNRKNRSSDKTSHNGVNTNEGRILETNDIELEKLAHKKKIEEEDKFIAQYIQIDCNICQQNFSTFQELRSHFYTQHKIKTGYVVCCNKKLTSRTSLLQHTNYHLDPNIFSCKICDKKFKSDSNLKYHVKFRHELEESQFVTCDVCQKKYPNQSILKDHKRTHIQYDEKPFKCTICQKSFSLASKLKCHVRCVHEKAYDCVCDICAKVFKRKQYLERHRLEHAGNNQPKSQCQKCGSFLKDESILRRHMKLHEEALMGLKCDICGKEVPSKGALRHHVRYIHKQERKFKCTICEKAFKERKPLKEHIASHTGEPLYKCSFCPQEFIFKASMYTHRKSVHPKEWENLKQQRTTPMLESASNIIVNLPDSIKAE